MLNNVLKLEYASSTINFDENEVEEIDVAKIRASEILRRQDRKPIIYFTEKEWRKITVLLYPDTPTTITKINSLRSVTDTIVLTQYYSDGSTQVQKLRTKINRNISTYFHGGHLSAEKRFKLIFYETGKVAAVEITLYPIGRI